MARSEFVVQVSDLVGFPGRRRTIEISAPLDIALPQAQTTDDPAIAEVRLDATTDGVVARGEITADVALVCNRCLREIRTQQRASFDQVYGFVEAEDVDPITSEGEIDLEPALRDELALSLPLVPTCRPDCLGLCPTCGTDLNSEPCSGHSESSDSPFAALRDLVEPSPGVEEPS